MYLSLPTRTICPSIIAKVRGSRIVNVEPCPGVEEISILPLSESIFLLTTSIPTPLPDTAVIFSAVDNPARKTNLNISSSLKCWPCSSKTTFYGLLQNTLFIKPFAVVLNLYNNVARLMISTQFNSADRIFPVLARSSGCLNSMIHGVTNHMNQRVGNFIHDVSVKLCFFAASNKIYLLAGLVGGREQTRHFSGTRPEWEPSALP